jgi:uncharacterized membrane protein YgcG
MTVCRSDAADSELRRSLEGVGVSSLTGQKLVIAPVGLRRRRLGGRLMYPLQHLIQLLALLPIERVALRDRRTLERAAVLSHASSSVRTSGFGSWSSGSRSTSGRGNGDCAGGGG